MYKIITLTGEINSGKYNVALDLAKNSNVSFIHPFTDNESAFEEYHIVSKDALDIMIEEEEVLTETIVKGYRYVFFKSQLVTGYNVLIVDDYSLVNLREHWKGKLYSIKVISEHQRESTRIGVYLYNHEFNEVYNYGKDDFDELEWRIMDVFEPRD